MKRAQTIVVTASLFLAGILLAALINHATEPVPQNTNQETLLPPLPANPQRIICMTPSVTETVFALECGDRIIGVSDFCDYPPEAANLEKLGGFINPNLERLLALGPDLIIAQGKSE